MSGLIILVIYLMIGIIIGIYFLGRTNSIDKESLIAYMMVWPVLLPVEIYLLIEDEKDATSGSD